MRAWLGCVIAGCYSPSPPLNAPCDVDSPCPTGQVCSLEGRCVEPGNGGDVDAPIAIDACETPSTCEGDVLVTCGSRVTCDFGCAIDRCKALVPSNQLTPDLFADVTADLVLDKLNFDTETGQIKRMNVDIRPPGEGVLAGIRFSIVDGAGVFTATRFDLPSNETWSINGDNPLTLFAVTTIAIGGTIDVGASFGIGGPGGGDGGTSTLNPPCRGLFGAQASTGFGAGGGGGGGETTGGAGGPSNGPVPGDGGSACNVPSVTPLRGGNGGGAGGVDAGNVVRGGRGGGAGGAVSLVAMDSITIAGTLAAPGAGGFSGATGDGGGGGGGGGAIFLESPRVTLAGRLTANGGGGAGPSASSGGRGSTTTATPAAGGAFGGGVGGAGGAGVLVPGSGTNATDGLTFSRGGGGGGAVGQIEVRALDVTIDAAALTSPPHATSTAIVQ